MAGEAGRASDPDLSWPPTRLGPDQGGIGFVIEDTWRFSSQIRVYPPSPQPVCSSLDDPSCVEDATKYGWWLLRVAPPCQTALAWEDCVESLVMVPRQGPTRSLALVGTAPGPTFAPDDARGLPTGSTMSLFRDPDDPDPSRGYAVYLGGQMGARYGERFGTGDFSSQIIPYRTVPFGQQPNAGTGGGHCLWVDANQCAYRTPFPEDVAFRLSFRMSKWMTGWLGGRLLDPSIQIEPLRNNLNRLTVTARPVDVPLVAHALSASDATPEIRAYWDSNYNCAGIVPCSVGVVIASS